MSEEFGGDGKLDSWDGCYVVSCGHIIGVYFNQCSSGCVFLWKVVAFGPF